MEFDPLDYPIAWELPRLVSKDPTWLGHIPFAFVLVQLLRPRTIVELGTQGGDSYCALCQAVQTLKLPARCTAIDTWTGDAHSGFYDSQVLDSLRRHHDPLYGKFSQLLQSDFDASLSRFEEESIDLLHIDGYHTYEAVHHDYVTWLPKVSRNGVILFHDTMLRGHDLGVWKLWEQITEKRKHFHFEQSHGLGVLWLGSDSPTELDAFFRTAAKRPVAIQQFYSGLGNRVNLNNLAHVLLQSLSANRRAVQEWKARTNAAFAASAQDLRSVFESPIPCAMNFEEDLLNVLLGRNQTL